MERKGRGISERWGVREREQMGGETDKGRKKFPDGFKKKMVWRKKMTEGVWLKM